MWVTSLLHTTRAMHKTKAYHIIHTNSFFFIQVNIWTVCQKVPCFVNAVHGKEFTSCEIVIFSSMRFIHRHLAGKSLSTCIGAYEVLKSVAAHLKYLWGCYRSTSGPWQCLGEAVHMRRCRRHLKNFSICPLAQMGNAWAVRSSGCYPVLNCKCWKWCLQFISFHTATTNWISLAVSEKLLHVIDKLIRAAAV